MGSGPFSSGFLRLLGQRATDDHRLQLLSLDEVQKAQSSLPVIGLPRYERESAGNYKQKITTTTKHYI